MLGKGIACTLPIYQRTAGRMCCEAFGQVGLKVFLHGAVLFEINRFAGVDCPSRNEYE